MDIVSPIDTTDSLESVIILSPKDKEIKKSIKWTNDDELSDFIKDVLNEAEKNVEALRHLTLEHAYVVSKDKILDQPEATNRDSAENSEKTFSLPTTFSDSSNKSNDLPLTERIPVSLRGAKKTWSRRNLTPKLLEGVHKHRPKSVTTIHVHNNFAVDDLEDLTHLPYFGDDDGDDVVSGLYDLERRRKMLDLRDNYLEDQIIDETLRLMLLNIKGSIEEMQSCLKYQDLCIELKRILDPKQGQVLGEGTNIPSTNILSKLLSYLSQHSSFSVERVNNRYNKLISNPILQPNSDDDVEPSESIEKDILVRSTGTVSDTLTKKKVPQNSQVTDDDLHGTYENIIDSYRSLFCRRCFTYDCNIHGNISQPSLENQTKLAFEKMQSGKWEAADRIFEANYPDVPMVNKTKKRKLNLSPLQKIILPRAYCIFQGNANKIATTFGCDLDPVVKYINDTNFNLEDSVNVEKDPNENKKQKKYKDMRTSKGYNPRWLKRFEEAENFPMFTPCCHDLPCNEETCDCVKNAFFCTKHCVWGEKSRNFFRGCSCTKSSCNTKSCPCFLAKRECDPDLCLNCSTCTDPPNQAATTQRCRNDNITMKRSCHLLVGISSIEGAGWGIYNKYALKKGDYIHEYVGEMISQEEAERRGAICDKLNSSYLFTLNSEIAVDALRKGNKVRFVNHSSKPNCHVHIMTVNGDSRVGLYAKEDIEPQTELLFDYRYDAEEGGFVTDWMKKSQVDDKLANK